MAEPNYPNDLMRLVNGFQISQAIHVAAVLGIADLLAGGALSSDDLARKTATDSAALYRLLRALAAAGVFHEDGEKRFALTPLGAGLTADAPVPAGPWAALVGRPHYWDAWGDLLHSIRTGENAFRHVNGASIWEYRARHPEEGRIFDTAMAGLSRQVSQAIVHAYDFGAFGQIADIGGGRGAILAAILAANPALRGVLFDQPQVIANAGPVLEAAGVAERCEVAEGNFFESVPAGSDAYILKSILHDWNDAEAGQILQVCRAAIPAGGRLLLVEQIIASPNEGLIGKLSDLNMLVAPSGRERTAAEFAELVERAGFRLGAVIPTASALSILECFPV